MNLAEIITPWGNKNGSLIAQLALDYPLTQTDVTSQPSENLPPESNLFVVRATMTDAVLLSIEADSTYEVLWSDELPPDTT